MAAGDPPSVILFFVVRGQEYTVHYYAKLHPGVRVIFYDELFRAGSLPAGCYVFADLERLSPEESELAGRVWRGLERAAGRERLLNHPLRAMRRYELLRALHERGINGFDAYRLTEGRPPRRWPVFLREEDRHGSICSELLRSPGELERAVEALVESGECREDKLVVEYCDASGPDGLHRVYSSFVVRGRAVPSHVLVSRDWRARTYDPEFDVDWARKEDLDYLKANPNERELAEVARVAGIEYGRVDYGLSGGRVQVWEINTNPTVLEPYEYPPREENGEAFFCEAFRKALGALPGAAEPSGRVSFEPALSLGESLKRRVVIPLFARLPWALRARLRGKKRWGRP